MKTAVNPWQNRIVGHGEEAPEKLLANPSNWRLHGKNQRAALSGSLDTVGWVSSVLVNQRTGAWSTTTRAEPTVPVTYADPSPDEEALVLATLDPIGRWRRPMRRSSTSCSPTSASTTRILDALAARMPFPVRAISVDGGSQFMADFEAACADRSIAPYVLPPRSPKLNGGAERANRAHTEESCEVTDIEPDLAPLAAGLADWEHTYNHIRPHPSLGYRTPPSSGRLEGRAPGCATEARDEYTSSCSEPPFQADQSPDHSGPDEARLGFFAGAAGLICALPPAGRMSDSWPSFQRTR